MDKGLEASDFKNKFGELNEDNKKYIMAIQQALIFAQSKEKLKEPPKQTA